MARFENTGADQATGSEAGFGADAATQQEAAEAARSRGVLVSSARQLDHGTLNYARRAIPEYDRILREAKVLVVFSLLCWVSGFIVLACGAMILFRGAEAGFLVMGAGAGSIVLGALLRMFAEIALAIRDGARNTFRHDD